MTARDEFLDEVRSHLGYREPGDGVTRFGIWYADRVGDPQFRTGAWCDMFLSYCGVKIGAGDAVGVHAWTVAHAKWFAARGRFDRKPRPGAIVFFDWSGSHGVEHIDHVGVVESVRGNGDLVTLEGNTEDRVLRRVRSMRTVVGFGHPKWAATGKKPAKKPARRRRRFRVVVTTRVAGNVRQVYLIPGKGFSYSRRGGRAFMTAGEVEQAKKWARKRRTRTFRVLRPGEWSHLRLAAGVKWPTDRALLVKLNAVARARRRIVELKSGLRSLADQWRLWRAFQNGTGNTAAYPNANAPHVRGVAADCGVINPDGSYTSIGNDRRARRLLKKHGLCLPVGPSSVNPRGEAWHVQTLATGGAWRAL